MNDARIPSSLVSNSEYGKKVSVSVDIHESYGFAFSESTSDHYDPEPEYNVAFVSMTIRYLHQRFNSVGHLFLNEALQTFGFHAVTAGQLVGWKASDGPLDIDFKHVALDDQPEQSRIWVTMKPHGIIFDRV